MAVCKTWNYPQNNKYVEQFKKLFSSHGDIVINNMILSCPYKLKFTKQIQKR